MILVVFVKSSIVKKLMTCVSLFLIFVLCSCNNSAKEYKNDENKNRHIIIDTDTGADDASAIILAAKDKGIDILGVTVLAGNVKLSKSVDNALMALEVAGRDVAVYKGAEYDLLGNHRIPFSVFGEDGMGDMDLIHPTGKAEEMDAVDFIIDSVKKYPNEIEIVCLGPATNIANAIMKDRETMKKVKMIWAMGTAGLGHGNATPVSEFIKSYETCDASCIVDEGETYAEVIFYRQNHVYDAAKKELDYHVNLITSLDEKNFFNNFLKRISK